MGARQTKSVTINRAPVLTLWAAVVAEALGYDWDEALTFGHVVAGKTAASKARTLGLASTPAKRSEHQAGEKEPEAITLLGRLVSAVRTPQGLRATAAGKPESPEATERYLRARFGEAYEPARTAFRALARAYDPDDLEAQAFGLYEDFRPQVPRGTRGWGAPGKLDLEYVRSLAARARGDQSTSTTRRTSSPPGQRTRKK